MDYSLTREGTALLAALREIHTVSLTESFDSLLDLSLAKFLDLLRADHVTIALYDPRRRLLTSIRSQGDASLSPHNSSQHLTGIPSRVVAGEGVQNIRDLHELPGQIDYTSEARSQLCIPINYKARVLGLIDLQSRTVAHFTPAHVELATSLANEIAILVHHNSLAAARDKQVRQLTTLSSIAQALRSSPEYSIDDLLQLLYEQVSLLMDTTNFYVAFVDNNKTCLRFPFAVENGKRVADKIDYAMRPFTTGLTEYVVRHDDPLLISSDVAEFCKSHNIQPVGQEAKSWVGAPMTHAGRVIGVIGLQNFATEWAYDEQDLHVLSTVAMQFAVTIENTHIRQHLENQQRQLTQILEVARFANGAITEEPREVLRQIVRGFCTVLDASNAVVYPYDARRNDDRYDTRNFVSYGTRHNRLPSVKPRKSGGVAAMVQEEGILVVKSVETASELIRNSPFIKREGICSFVGLSLVVGDEVVGIMYVNYTAPHPFRSEELTLINILGQQAAVAIKNSRMMSSIRDAHAEALRNLQRLRRIDNLIVQSIRKEVSWGNVIARILHECVDATNADSGSIMWSEPEADELVMTASHGVPPERQNFRQRLNEGVVGIAASTKRPVLVNDTTTSDQFLPVVDNSLSELAVPLVLVSEDRVLGVINVESRSRNAFAERDENTLTLLAGQVIVALENFSRFQKDRDRILALRRLNDVIGSTLNVDDVLRIFVKTIGNVCPNAVHREIFLFDEARQVLVAHASASYPTDDPSTNTFHLNDQAIVCWVARERKPLLVPDVTAEPRYFCLVRSTQSELAVPITDATGLLKGVLNLESSRIGAFDTDDQDMFLAMASQVALALDRAEQYAKLSSTYEELQRSKAQIAETDSRVLRGLQHFFSARFHSIGNPISGIREKAANLLSGVSEPSLRKSLQEIVSTSEQVDQIAADSESMLREFLKDESTDCRIDEIVSNAIAQIGSLPDNITIDKVNLADAPTFVSNRILITEVFLELLRNAVDAIHSQGTSGRIWITAKPLDDEIEISVSDDGPGLPDEGLDIFMLGVTKRKKGAHRGRGLFNAYLIVKTQRGAISAGNRKTGGAEFRVVLPRRPSRSECSPVNGNATAESRKGNEL